MIRRLTWLVLGACLGISGYRRASRVLRELAGPRRPRGARIGAGRRAGPLADFARDVREGMELYEQQRRDAGRQALREGPTLEMHQARWTRRAAGQLPASGNGSSAAGLQR